MPESLQTSTPVAGRESDQSSRSTAEATPIATSVVDRLSAPRRNNAPRTIERISSQASLSAPNAEPSNKTASAVISAIATPIPLYAIMDATPVVVGESHSETVATIQPDAEGRVVSPDGSAEVVFPILSRSRTFQAGVASNRKHCHYGTEAPDALLSCVRVDIFDRFGNVEEDVVLDSPAIVNMVVNPMNEALKRISDIDKAYESESVRLLFREHLNEKWSETPFSMSVSSGEGVRITTTRDKLGIFALVADEDSLSQTEVQSIEATAASPPPPIPDATEEIATEEIWPGAAIGSLIVQLAPYLIFLWYARMMGLPL